MIFHCDLKSHLFSASPKFPNKIAFLTLTNLNTERSQDLNDEFLGIGVLSPQSVYLLRELLLSKILFHTNSSSVLLILFKFIVYHFHLYILSFVFIIVNLKDFVCSWILKYDTEHKNRRCFLGNQTYFCISVKNF